MASTKGMTMSCELYLGTLTSGLKTLLESSQLCDVTLKVEGREFRCHKIILAANSDYFMSVFARGFKEEFKNEVTMREEFKADAFEAILNFFYSGKLLITPQTVENILIATDYLRLKTLIKMCFTFLLKTLNDANCVHRYCLAEKFHSEELSAAAANLILDGAKKMCTNPQFLNLDMETITKLLKSNTKPQRAESLFMAIVKWVEHDQQNREKLLCKMLQLLAVEGLSFNFRVTTMKNEKILRENMESLQWLVDSFLPSSNSSTPDSLFITSRNFVTSPSFCVKLADPFPVKIQDRPGISNFSSFCLQNQIYLICGTGTEKSFKLNESQTEWLNLDLDLRFQRWNAGTVVLNDVLYVVGGWGSISQSGLGTCEKFDFGSLKRIPIPDMKEKRELPGVAIYENSIYVACGRNATSTIERFDPREGKWNTVGSYLCKIDNCSSASVANFFYSCDVYSGQIERFDVRAERTQEVCTLTTNGRSCWITSMNNKLYGGLYNKIVKYDGGADCWENFSSPFDCSYPILVSWFENKP